MSNSNRDIAMSTCSDPMKPGFDQKGSRASEITISGHGNLSLRSDTLPTRRLQLGRCNFTAFRRSNWVWALSWLVSGFPQSIQLNSCIWIDSSEDSDIFTYEKRMQ